MNKTELTMIEFFSGIGAQKRGIDNTNLYDLKVVATSDVDKEALVEYAAIHHGLTNEIIENYKDYPDRDTMIEELSSRNIGMDFDKGKMYDWNKLKKKKTKDLEKYWLAMKLQNNLGDISKIEQAPEADCWFYSSPCQCFSLAGKQDGIDATCNACGEKYNPMLLDVDKRYICPNCGSDDIKGTRSGLLLEIERLLVKAIETNTAPKYLCLENVKNLVGKQFKPDFDAWVKRLEYLNYNTYWTVLNAKSCGIPQNRERVFAFSIRKDIDTGKYTFPIPFDNGLRLKDVLEKNVDEKYYINTERASNLIQQLVDKGQLKGQRECCDSTIKDPNIREISNSIIARYDAGIQNVRSIGTAVAEPNTELQPILVKNQGTEYVKDLDESVTLKARDWKGWDNYGSTAVVESEKIDSSKRIGGLWDGETRHQAGSVWDINGMSPTLDTAQGGGRTPHVIEKENNDKIQWKDINDFPYQISEYGEIRNVNTGHIRSLRKDKYGYLRTELYNSGFQKTVMVHRLVAEYFLPKSECMECVNHKDGDIYNNHYSNLEWCSFAENTKHKNEILLHISGKINKPKGVSWNKEKEKWEASIKYHGKTQYLGRYINESDAYKAAFYGFCKLRGYMPWDENKYRTFLKDGETIGDFDQEEIRENKINEYLQHVEDTSKPIYVRNTTPSGKSQCNAVYSAEGVSQTLCAGTHGYSTGNIVEENEVEFVNIANSNYVLSSSGEVFIDKDGIRNKLENKDGMVELLVSGSPRQVSVEKLMKKYFQNIETRLNNEKEKTVIGIKQATKKGYIECELPGVADLSFPNSKTRRGRVEDNGQIVPTLTAAEGGIRYIENIYRIRKLTPRETSVLMGFTFEDCDKCSDLGVSNSSLYKAHGNSIVTNCISLLFEHLYKAQYDESYICTDEKMQNFQKPEAM